MNAPAGRLLNPQNVRMMRLIEAIQDDNDSDGTWNELHTLLLSLAVRTGQEFAYKLADLVCELRERITPSNNGEAPEENPEDPQWDYGFKQGMQDAETDQKTALAAQVDEGMCAGGMQGCLQHHVLQTRRWLAPGGWRNRRCARTAA